MRDLTFHWLTPETWNDFERLFGSKGACGGCWCMHWRLSHAEYEHGKGEGNRRAIHALVAAGERPGILAYDGDEPVAWCALAPRPAYARLSRSRVLAPVDDREVWSIVCFFVARAYRRRGTSTALLRAAADMAGEHGARVLEGYPVEPRNRKAPPVFVFTGLAAAFRAAGFREVARRSETRPIMRLETNP